MPKPPVIVNEQNTPVGDGYCHVSISHSGFADVRGTRRGIPFHSDLHTVRGETGSRIPISVPRNTQP